MNLLKKIWIVVVGVLLFSCSNTLSNDLLAEKSVAQEEGYGYIKGRGWTQKIKYEVVNGVYIYEGDIAIPEEDIYDTLEEADSRGIVTDARLWPNNTIHYEIASNVYNRSIILNAFKHVEARSNVKFIEHSAAVNPSGNYLYFKPDSGSWSYIGCTGRGKQDLALADWATTGTAVHEICHALGVYHEQSRKDRDDYLIINFSNIKTGMEGNFSKATGVRDMDIGYFDFTSIMLYGPTAFSKNGQPTITKKDGSTYSTQRNALSSQDIKGLNHLYPGGINPDDTEAPSKPAGLVSTAVTSSSVSLSWNAATDNVGVTGYIVYVNGTQKATVSATNTTIAGLTALTTYQISVSAIDAAGNESLKSASISVKTLEGSSGGTEWKTYTPYQAGDTVTYSGSTYTCITSHTSLPGWNPAAVPALWRKL